MLAAFPITVLGNAPEPTMSAHPEDDIGGVELRAYLIGDARRFPRPSPFPNILGPR